MAVQTKNQNKRAYDRIPVDYRVKVVTPQDIVSFSTALNVSRGGILLAPKPPLRIGAQVGVAIFFMGLGGDDRIVRRGTVVRCDEGGNAIHFTEDMDEHAFQSLVRLLPSKQPELAGR